MAKLLYQGHGSIRLTTDGGRVIYVDPYAGKGYDLPADLILVTHEHGDHNQIDLVPVKNGTVVITYAEALSGGKHNSFMIDDIKIEAVTASNMNHNPELCVGFIILVDGKTIYAAGDTSKTEQMKTFPDLHIDYALLPCDGIYNMDPTEAAECAAIIKAKHNIPIHMKPGELFDIRIAENWNAPNKIIVKPDDEIEL